MPGMVCKATILKSLIANILAALQHVKVTAEQCEAKDLWALLVRYVSDKIASNLAPFSYVRTGWYLQRVWLCDA